MSYSIAEYLTKKGYKIGVDVIRVTPDTQYQQDNFFPNDEKYSMHALNMGHNFYYDGQGVGVIANPVTKEYFVSLDKDLIREVAEEFKLSREEPNLPGYAYNIKFVDQHLQKLWAKHAEYMLPENVQQRNLEKAESEHRAEMRKFYDKKAKPLVSIKDIVRQAGFVPDDYVTLQDGMAIYLDSVSGIPDRKIRLPKEEDVSAKRYIAGQSGYFIIGDTNTHEAILTRSHELLKEFEDQGFEQVNVKEFKSVRNYSNINFYNEKTQNQWEKHQKRDLKEKALIKKEALKYVKQHYTELKKNVAFYRSFYYSDQSDDFIIHDVAKQEVLKARKKARYATRNMTTTRDEERNENLKARLHAKSISKKVLKKETPAKEQPAPAPQESATPVPLWKRIFGHRSR